MGSIWFSKKAFLYFGGVAIILLGGMIVVMSPYHYINYNIGAIEHRTWEVYDESGYYPQVEISVSLRPSNTSYVYLDLVFKNNCTNVTTFLNLTLGPEHQLQGPDSIIYEYSEIIDLPIGNYTVFFDRIDGAGNIDFGLNQISDSRIWIVTGGSMNILGIFMGIAGYFVPGTFLPSDTDTIIEWGYDEKESNQ